MGSYGCDMVQDHGGIEKQEIKRVKWSRMTCFGTHGHECKKQELLRDG